MENYQFVEGLYGEFSIFPLPSEKELEEFYTEKYFQNSVSSGYSADYTEKELVHIKVKNQEIIEAIEEFIKIENSKILEIGFGEGFLLESLLEKKGDIFGIDYSLHGINKHNPNILKYTKQGSIEEELKLLINEEKKYDLIIAKHVIEHAISPEKTIGFCRSLLNKNGLIFIQVPNDFSDLQNFLLEYRKVTFNYWVSPPAHLHYFNHESIVRLLESNSFEVIDFFSTFPIDWFLLNKNSNYIDNPDLGKAAHRARIDLELLISKVDSESRHSFYQALSKVGMGRDLCLIAKVS